MATFQPILAFVVSIAFIVFLLSKKFVPAFCLILGSIVAGVLGGLPIGSLASTLGTSFSKMLAQSGLMLLFALIYSEYLDRSGGVIELSKAMLRISGTKYDVVALAVIGYLLGISVSYVCALTIIAPMIKEMSRLTKKPLPVYAAAFAVPARLSAQTVVPTFGPVMVASALEVNMGWFMFWGIVATIPGFLVSMLIVPVLNKKFSKGHDAVVSGDQLDLSRNPKSAGAGLTLAMILLPIALIVFGAFIPDLLPKGSVIQGVVKFIGNAAIAMMISVIVSMIVFRPYLPAPNNKIFQDGIRSAGPILVILGAASTYSGILTAAGIGEAFVTILEHINLPILLLSAVLLVAFKTGTGAGSVASVTVIPILRPMIEQTGTSLIMFGEMIGVAQSMFHCPTDVTYWVYKDVCGLTDKETWQSAFWPNTIVALVSIAWVMIINRFAPGLPGLF